MNTHTATEASLYLVATLRANRNDAYSLLDALTALVPQSRAEAGCIQYDLHVDVSDPARFVVYEIWRDQAALDQHAGSAHFQTFLKTAEPLLAAPLDVRVMQRIV